MFCIQREREDGRKHDLLHPARERRWQCSTTKQDSTSQNSHKQMYIASKYTSLCKCVRVCMCVCVHVCKALQHKRQPRGKARTCAHGCAGISILVYQRVSFFNLRGKKIVENWRVFFPYFRVQEGLRHHLHIRVVAYVSGTVHHRRDKRCALARQPSAPLFCVRKKVLRLSQPPPHCKGGSRQKGVGGGG